LLSYVLESREGHPYAFLGYGDWGYCSFFPREEGSRGELEVGCHLGLGGFTSLPCRLELISKGDVGWEGGVESV